ncbi:protein SET-like [Spea bombifrons]|uniref:protein SET-like n=1 Tax=Spea bombifrons TaxID=233779 RepID=UPI002349D23D|nr:protein SET-like [Spea bombifrons]XP_053329371.1 protein SET-like [Spea bombifrons]XP_053329372.1 protein SET-like [Spea bombifrons]
MSCPEDKEDCAPPVAKQPRIAETEDKGCPDGAGDVPVSQEAEAAQALWEMTNWRDGAEQGPKEAESQKCPLNVTPHPPERNAEGHQVALPRRTPERGDTGESGRGTPHSPEGGETGEKNAKQNKDFDDADGAPQKTDSEEELVLSPLSTDSELGDPRSCSEGDECCIVSVGTQPTGTERSLQALESVQQELRSVNERADRALLQLKRRYGHLRKPHIQKRNAIIRTIPGFWVTAFLNHPQLSAMIDDRDEDTLSYMNNLQVEDFTHLKSSCKIKFYFNPNPYFKNEVIVKEFQYGTAGRLVSRSTPIRWWRGQNPATNRGKSSNSAPSFFSWFSDHSFPAADRIAAIIKEDLWPNPLQYYLIGEGDSDDSAAQDSDTDNGDDCVVIVDDDEEGEEEDDNEDDEENDIHEISSNTEKHNEDTDEDDEVEVEESVPEDMVESTIEEQGSGDILLDPNDSEQSCDGEEDKGDDEDG